MTPDRLRPDGRLCIAYNYGTVAPAESRRLTGVIGARLDDAGFDWRLIDPDQVEQAFMLEAHSTRPVSASRRRNSSVVG